MHVACRPIPVADVAIFVTIFMYFSCRVESSSIYYLNCYLSYHGLPPTRRAGVPLFVAADVSGLWLQITTTLHYIHYLA